MTRYDILSAASAFLNALKECSEDERDAAYQVIAGRANDSEYGTKCEPYSGLAVACQAHEARLAFDAREAEAEVAYYLDAHECSECGAEAAVAFIGPATQRRENDFLVQCGECGEVESLGDTGPDYDHATRRAESGYAQ